MDITRTTDTIKSNSSGLNDTPATRVNSKFYSVIKRIIDIFGAVVGIIVLSIPMLVIAIAVKVDSRGNVLFKQLRMGKNMQPFTFYKFRSMSTDAPHNKATADFDKADCYITRVGKFLRRFSLDEIPQLFNIFFGEMSFIGPRPVIVEETELIEKREAVGVYLVRPGLSGWAQINGRDLVTIDSKVAMDLHYVKRESFRLDLIIFVRSIFYALSRKGVQEGSDKQNNSETPAVTVTETDSVSVNSESAREEVKQEREELTL